MKKQKINIYYLSKEDNIPFYIGKTKSVFSKRIYSHKLKFGNNIKIELIDIVEENEWKFWESYWIEQFKQWGFNLENKNKGGGGLEHHIIKTKEKISNSWNSKSKEEKRNINIKRGLGNLNKKKPNSGYKNQSKEDIQKLIQRSPFNKSDWNEQCKKQVLMLDKTTKQILKEFKSVTEAAASINRSQPSLSDALNGKSKTSGGYIWKFKNK